MKTMMSRACGMRAGFTLVEIMIVVGIIGVLSALALPSFMKSRQKAKVNATANDFRIFYDAFQQYAMAAGNFSSDPADPGVLPSYMGSYINSNKWSMGPQVGGQWYYKSTSFGALGGRPALGIVGSITAPLDGALMLEIDKTIDNGDLGSGIFIRLGANAYYMYLDM